MDKTSRWLEDVREERSRTAVKTKPSFPNLVDEREATDPNLWERVLQVASGDLREFTEGGRTIHAPNEGRGYRNMPHNPKGIAWAIKQYNGYGGNWRGQKEASWSIRAGLGADLVRKVDALKSLGDKYDDDQTAISSEDKAAIADFAAWFRRHFGRVDSAKTPRGQKLLKQEAASFLRSLEVFGSPTGTTFSGVFKNLDSGPWGRTLSRDLDALVKHFTAEGSESTGKREPVVEIKLSHAVYFNKSNASESSFEKYAKAIDATLSKLKGWKAKALKGTLKVVFQGASQMRSQGKYIQAKDELWVKATPAVLKRGGGTYGSPEYIIVHELGHRYEKFNPLPTDFDQAMWWTTRYSRTQGFGGSESFAELFALDHFGIKGSWDASIIDRFEDVMKGRKMAGIDPSLSSALKRMAAGGVEMTQREEDHVPMRKMALEGLVKLSSTAGSRYYWDITKDGLAALADSEPS